MRNIFIGIFFGLILAARAHAGFYFEPFAGYQQGTSNYKIKDTIPTIGGQTDKGTLNGATVGLAAGWKFDSKFVLGFDFNVMNIEEKMESLTTKTKWQQTSPSVFFGYEVQPATFVYLGGGSFQSVDDGSPKTTLKGATAKIGANYRYAPHLSVNAEYITYTTSESQTAGSAAVKIADMFQYYTYNAVVFSFRIPVTFGK